MFLKHKVQPYFQKPRAHCEVPSTQQQQDTAGGRALDRPARPCAAPKAGPRARLCAQRAPDQIQRRLGEARTKPVLPVPAPKCFREDPAQTGQERPRTPGRLGCDENTEEREGRGARPARTLAALARDSPRRAQPRGQNTAVAGQQPRGSAGGAIALTAGRARARGCVQSSR